VKRWMATAYLLTEIFTGSGIVSDSTNSVYLSIFFKTKYLEKNKSKSADVAADADGKKVHSLCATENEK
jgi:hypothetical protein